MDEKERICISCAKINFELDARKAEGSGDSPIKITVEINGVVNEVYCTKNRTSSCYYSFEHEIIRNQEL